MGSSSRFLNDVDETSQRIDHTSLGVLGTVGITQRQSLRVKRLGTDRTRESRLGQTVDPDRLTIPRVVTNVAQVQIVDACLGPRSVGNILVVGMVDAADVPVLDDSTIVLVNRHQSRGIVAVVVHVQDIGVATAVHHARYLISDRGVDLAHLDTSFVRDRRRTVPIV